ncbi:MAG: type II toxin-antitoxin system VapC family toxin [bacterium]
MRPKVYVETSVISYLTSRPSRDIVVAANQEVTRDWWGSARSRFDLYISEAVVQEIAEGDPEAAAERKRNVMSVPMLIGSPEALALTKKFLSQGAVPARAATDALHIAMATVYGIDYVVTWNYKHIANALAQRKIARISRSCGYEPPVLCTPLELLEDYP